MVGVKKKTVNTKCRLAIDLDRVHIYRLFLQALPAV